MSGAAEKFLKKAGWQLQGTDKATKKGVALTVTAIEKDKPKKGEVTLTFAELPPKDLFKDKKQAFVLATPSMTAGELPAVKTAFGGSMNCTPAGTVGPMKQTVKMSGAEENEAEGEE